MTFQHSPDSFQANGKRHADVAAAAPKMEKRSTPLSRRADATQCRNGALYSAPARGATVDTSAQTTISWDQTCLTSSKIDIYLYAPETQTKNLPIHAWKSIPADKGSYDVKLAPKWWAVNPNITSQTVLSLNIVSSGNEPWDTANPLGPTWSATYTAPALGKSPPADAVVGSNDKENGLISVFYSGGSLTAGGKAAAIICPLVIFLVVLGVYLRKHHINRNNKTADWADHMDKRMSRISLDWNAGGDGSAGPVPGSRPASYYPRPSQDPNGSFFPRPSAEMREMAGGNRQSRISFAHNTQGERISRTSFGGAEGSVHSGNGQRTQPRGGRSGLRDTVYSGDSEYAGHEDDEQGAAVARPSNAYRHSASSSAYAEEVMRDDEEDDLRMMSPTQNAGAYAIGNEDVAARVKRSMESTRQYGTNKSLPSHPTHGHGHAEEDGSNDHAFRDSVIQYPAVSYMQGDEEEATGRSSSAGHRALVAPNKQDLFATRPTSNSTTSSDGGYFAAVNAQQQQQQQHAANGRLTPAGNFSSPDDALRQYAALRSGAGTPYGGPDSVHASPAGAVSSPGGVRTLYSPMQHGNQSSASIPIHLAQQGGAKNNAEDFNNYH